MTLEERLRRVVEGAGRLYQPHPAVDHWRTTRPGGHPGEVSAWVHEHPDVCKSYISLITHDAAETDEDGYTWETAGYEVLISRGDGSQDYHTATSLDAAITEIAHEMRERASC